MSNSELPWGKLAAIAGLAFAILLFWGTASLNIPQDATDREVVDWWSDSGNQTYAIISMYAFAFAGLFFVGFLSHLRARLRAAEGGSGTLASVSFAGGMLFVALMTASGVARGLIATSVKVYDEPLPGVDVLRYVPLFSYGFTTVALLAAGLATAATSVLIFRTRAFARWAGWLGVVASILLLVGTVALGGLMIPVILLWTLAMSFEMWRDREAVAG